jgi:hypothetical protein
MRTNDAFSRVTLVSWGLHELLIGNAEVESRTFIRR